MPRLDNSDVDVIEFYDLAFDEDDPGKTPPIDLCYDCFLYDWGPGLGIEIEHPSYSLDEYRCYTCKEPLTAEDD